MDSFPGSRSSDAPPHRCFFALGFCPQAVEHLASVIDQLKRHDASVRWVPPENLHLTLRFLGEITDQQLEQTIALLERSQVPGPADLRLKGLGSFPNMRAPRVLWAGVQGRTQHDTDTLMAIHSHTERWAREVGLAPENRRYSPHVTIGRVRQPLRNMPALMADVIGRELESPFCHIDQLLLMRSTLTDKGSIYEVVGRREAGKRGGREAGR